MTVRAITTADLPALDNGAFRVALDRYEAGQPTSDLTEIIWRAEIALYLDRLQDARKELDRIRDRLDSTLSHRVQIISAEIAFWDNALDEATALISPVIQATRVTSDLQGHMRSLLLLARIALRRGDTTEALERLKAPQRFATVLGNDFYAGIIAHCRAYALYDRGNCKQAGHAFAEALHLLAQSEGLRWEAGCRVVYSLLLADLGRYDEAIAACDRGQQVASDLGIIGDALWALSNAARTLSLQGRFEEVIERLKDILTWQRSTRHLYAEMLALQMLATAHCELTHFDEAERIAAEARQLAELANSGAGVLDGAMLVAWAGARAGKAKALEQLHELIATCDQTGSDFQKAEVRLYAADVLAQSQPDVAATLCQEARTFPAAEDSGRLHRLLHRIEQTLIEGPMQIGPCGELIFDLSRGWPDFDTAIETVERFLVSAAVRSSDGNRAEAARKLKLTRSRLHDLWHQLQDKPRRPGS